MARVPIPIVVWSNGPVAGAAVRPKLAGTNTDATVYTSRTGGSTVPLPISSDASGRVLSYFVDRGAYDVQVAPGSSGLAFATYSESFDAAPGADGSFDSIWLPSGSQNLLSDATAAAMAGSSGTPSGTNKFVTAQDAGYQLGPDLPDTVWQPKHNGLKGWTFDPALIGGTGQPFGAGGGSVALVAVPVFTTQTFANVLMYVATAGATLSTALCGLYTQSGTTLTRIATTASQTATWTSTGLKTMSLNVDAGKSLTVTGGAGVFVHVAMLATGTTVPFWYTLGTSTAAFGDAGIAGTGPYRASTASVSGGTLNTGYTPSFGVLNEYLWAGLS